jgi:dihydroxyacid dehydratase/phosphogluconate dehydratase
MGFNKCYLTKKSVKSFYERGGIKEVMNMLTKYDAYITEDCSYLLDFTTLDQIEKAEPEIKIWLYENERSKQ